MKVFFKNIEHLELQNKEVRAFINLQEIIRFTYKENMQLGIQTLSFS